MGKPGGPGGSRFEPMRLRKASLEARTPRIVTRTAMERPGIEVNKDILRYLDASGTSLRKASSASWDYIYVSRVSMSLRT